MIYENTINFIFNIPVEKADIFPAFYILSVSFCYHLWW